MGVGLGGAWGQTAAYDFGAPDGSEQLMIEHVNRSRLFPAAEAQGFRDAVDPAKRGPAQIDWNLADAYADFGVNMAVAVQRISALPAVPPVAPNAKLMAVARQHTQWMFANRSQSHMQPPDTSPVNSIIRRFTSAGYNYAGAGENIYAYGNDVYYAHAGFEVDWGGDDYGMQKPAGHRLNNHSKDHRELGVGLHAGYSGYGSGDVGPLVCTVDFGVQRSSSAYVTGVAYYDLNGNQRYDANEGIGGLRVDVEGAAHHAVTAPGGGYAVPVPTMAATRAVTLSGLRAQGAASAVMADGRNVKRDFVPAYQPPVLTVPGEVPAGLPAAFSFPTTPGAAAYEAVVAGLMPASPEKADTAAQLLSYLTPGRYSLLQASVRVGTAGGAIHLAHPELEDQWVMLKPSYVPGPAGSVTFHSWLRGSSKRQVARLQVSADDGQTWTDAWTKVGAATAATGWGAPVTVSLAAHAGRLVRLRFNYTVAGSTWVSGLGVSSGWFIDEISFADAGQLTASQTIAVPAAGSTAEFVHTPAAPGPLAVAVRPLISGRPWAHGPVLRLTVAEPTPFVHWARSEEIRLGMPPGSLALSAESASAADGVPALVRYALGLSAGQNAAARLPQAEASPQGLCVTYYRDLARTDVEVVLQVSADYLRWQSPGDAGAPAILSDSVVGLEGTLERRCAIIAPAQGRVAARLRVTPR